MKLKKPKWGDDDEDSDEIYDEIDKFHMQQDEMSDEDDTKVRQEEELLNVEGDTSEEDDEEINYPSDSKLSDFDDSEGDDIEAVLPSMDKWSKKKSRYYGTSYIDNDYGGMNEKELEVTEFEEQDATERQRKLDAALSFLKDERRATNRDSENVRTTTDSVPKGMDEMTEDEILNRFSELNPDFQQMMKEYSEKRTIFFRLIKPLKEAVDLNCDGRKTVLERKIFIAYNVYVSYLINIMFYLRLKLTTGVKSLDSRKLLDDHPVLDAIIEGKKMLLQVDNFLVKDGNEVDMILNLHKSGRSLNSIFDSSGIIDENDLERKKKKLYCNSGYGNAGDENVVDSSEFQDEDNDYYGNGQDYVSGEKRSITAEIQKNKGLTSKRKKGTQHSRVKKRKQYEKALIKKRSQRPDVRRELEPYGGEKRGIRISTIKSVKLKA